MVYINGFALYDMPGSCGTCPFLCSGSSSLCPQDKGLCILYDETHHTWANVPSRCKALFNKALRFPEGERLVLTNK